MKTRYTFGGDEHIYIEMDEEMSLDAFFKSLSMSNAVREAEIDGVTEICPANASFQVKFNPDVIHHDDLTAPFGEIKLMPALAMDRTFVFELEQMVLPAEMYSLDFNKPVLLGR